ncbi:serine/threonine-protein kinase [Actinocorallia libanotica]|uniref:Protein kinase domain-containing protein n=1 Tax=Actinocorallia libanotica TaxID=46162 RepID=A0ABN1R830_9ACTN
MLRRQVVLPAGVRILERTDPGKVGGYRLTGRVGAGGMGVVYTGLASDGRRVAVKVIRAEYGADSGFHARFAREVELMARVRSPGIAAVLDADTGAARPWLVTEYVPGPTLDQQVREHGPPAAGRVRTLALGVAEALAAVHAAGIVHRDLKPANVILSPDGPKVLDFGIARAADETSLTRTGVLIGSSGWISPEQYQGQGPGTAADLFALGAPGLRRRHPPFGTGTAEAVAFRVLQDEPDLTPVPDELRGLVTRCLAKDPADRPLASELVDALAGQWSPEDALAPTTVLTQLITEE